MRELVGRVRTGVLRRRHEKWRALVSCLNCRRITKLDYLVKDERGKGKKKKKADARSQGPFSEGPRGGLRALGRVATSRRWAQAVAYLAGALGAP